MKPFVFFWGDAPLEFENRYLSQWWDSPFSVNGIEYQTAEHFMMAEKARLFADYGTLELIMRSVRPEHAQRLARTVRFFDLRVWEIMREAVVFRGNLAKFQYHTELQKLLLSTDGRVLVESSPVDCIWGIGLSSSDHRAQDPAQWRGLNLLGNVLMRVRGVLKKS